MNRVHVACLVAWMSGFWCVDGVRGEEGVLEEGARFDILFSKGREDKFEDLGKDIDDRLEVLEPELRLTNRSFVEAKGNKVVLLLLGESVKERRVWKVLSRQEFKTDLPRGQEVVLKGKRVENKYDPVDNGSIFGHAYDGYIVVIVNSQGKPVVVKASKSTWKLGAAAGMALQEGKEYGKDDLD